MAAAAENFGQFMRSFHCSNCPIPDYLNRLCKLTPPYAEVQQHGLGCDGYVRDVDIVREVTGRIFVRV